MTTRLAGEPRSASAARAFVSSTLAGWGVDEPIEAVMLLTSELVTNAVLHAGSEVDLTVACGGGRVRVEVSDRSERPLERRFPGPEDCSGRGLGLVEALSSSWGVDARSSAGKSIWFEVPA